MTADGQLCPTCSTPLPAAAHFCLNSGTPTPTDRYLMEHVLGEGDMATVYLAEDLKHHRKVAVKRVYLATGQNDRAIDEIAKLLKSQYSVTQGDSKSDPMFKPLRGNPRFEKMMISPLSAPTG